MDSTGTIGSDSDVAQDVRFREEGNALLRQGRFTEAATALRQAVDADPKDEAAWRLLGGALASKGDYAEAVPAFEKAVFLAPVNARNFYNLGVALQSVGRDSEARSALETSIRIDPTYQQARQRMEILNRRSSPADEVVTSVISGSPSTAPVPMGGTIGFSPGTTPEPVQPTEPARMPGLSALGGHPGGMAGLGSLGDVATPPAAPIAPSSPSLGAPVLRQPAATPSAAAGSAFPYNPAAPYGSYAPNPVLGLRGDFPNTSGTIGDVPAEVSGGFNLGAAVITFWWLRNHNLRPLSIGLAVVYGALRFISNVTDSWIAPIILLLIQTGMFFTLGFIGNRIAWQNRRFDDIADFKACQRIWMYWAIPLVVVEVGFLILVFIGAASGGGTAHH